MITAVILAAGQSKRMGQPKMLLPWGGSTVLQTVISAFRSAGVDEVLVVTGGAREAVETLVGDSARTVFNAHHLTGGMLSSIQAGLAQAHPEAGAAFIALGDQPQVQPRTILALLESHQRAGAGLIVPSYQQRRGHPWLVERALWQELLCLPAPLTMRDFLNRHADAIHYVDAQDDSVLADLDTPEDYLKSRP
ncbi:MAG: nucleotidyltransferase family protein [Chloroflexota bacterium]